MELKDTINLMQSEDYKERFAAEYLQTKIRHEKLHKMLVRAEAGNLPFTPTCPIHLLEDQEHTMECYLRHLEVRAQYEGVDLEWYAMEKKSRVDVEKGDLLLRDKTVYEVVCCDEEIFVAAECEVNSSSLITNMEKIEFCANNPNDGNLEDYGFERYTLKPV